METKELPIPPHFDPDQVDRVWKVPYQLRAEKARLWAKMHSIPPASEDRVRICLLLVDVQNTFCIPGFELYVGGSSGTGAVDDNRRLCRFIYRNLNVISQITPTMDTHFPLQIFHTIIFMDKNGNHPAPFSLISVKEIEEGVWRFNPHAAKSLGVDPDEAQKYLLHYTRTLSATGKYELTVWPYHAMLGGIGHALVSSVEEALFFHSIVRFTKPDFQIKGDYALTENYSVIQPEVLSDSQGALIAKKNEALIRNLLKFDAVIIAGQAKSHCVIWTIEDLLHEIAFSDPDQAGKIYLLEDCTSPVVIPGGIDFTSRADAAFDRFSRAGVRICRSSDPISTWPGIRL
ncbi:MAG: isochorismatase [Thermodesulfobacteriota bacterium]